MSLAEGIQTAKGRIETIALEAVPDAKAIEAYGSFVYKTGYPYWRFLINTIPAPNEQRGTGLFQFNIQINSDLLVGAIGAGLRGEHEEKLMYEYAPEVLEYFYARMRLVATVGQSPPKHLDSENSSIGYSTIVTSFEDEKHSLQVLAGRFTHSLRFTIPIQQAF